MRTILLTCAFLSACFSGLAQPYDFHLIRKDLEKVDSLIFTLNQEEAYPVIRRLRKLRLSPEARLLLDVYEARTDFHNRELEKGLKKLNALEKPIDQTNDAYLKGNWLLAKGIYHFRQRENEELIATLNKAERVLSRSGTDSYTTLFFAIHYKVLTLWWRLADNKAATQEAKKLFEFVKHHAPGSVYYADASYSLGTLYQNQYDLDMAKSAFLESLSIAQKERWEQLENDCLVALGNLYYSAGRFQEATSFYTKAIDQEIERSGHRSRSLINYYNNCASSYKRSGKPDLAYSLLLKGKYLANSLAGEESLEASWFSLNLANFFLENERFDSARYYFKRNLSQKISHGGKKHDDVGWAYAGLAELHSKMLNYDSALYFIQRAIVAAHPTFESNSVATNPEFDSNLYSNSLFTFMYKKGLYLHRKSLSNRSDSLSNTTLSYYQDMEKLLLSRREIFSDDMTKIYLIADMKKVFELGLDVCYARLSTKAEKRGVFEMIFKILQMSKSAQLLEEILYGARRDGNGLDRAMFDSLRKYQTMWATFEDLSVDETTTQVSIAKRRSVKNKLDSINEIIAHLNPNLQKANLQNNLASLGELEHLLVASSASFAEFFWGSNAMYLFSYDGVDFGLKKIENVKEVETHLTSMLDILTTGKQLPGIFGRSSYVVCSVLFDQLFLNRMTSQEFLFVVPDGALALLPFEVLLTKEPRLSDGFDSFRYLLFDVPVGYSFNSQLIVNSPSTKGFASEVIALGAYSGLRSSFDNLPGSKKELDLIKQHWVGEFLYDASREDLLKSLTQNKILHVSVHGGTDTLSIFGSYLKFLDKHHSQNRLYSNELYSKTTYSPLVVLSACQSGFGKVVRGEGILSLGRAFKISGAGAVVQSLWKTDDDASVEIMGEFYRAMSDGEPPLKALHEARKTLLAKSDSKTAHPARWAAFVYYGDLKKEEYGILFSIVGFAMAATLFLLYVISKRQNLHFSVKRKPNSADFI